MAQAHMITETVTPEADGGDFHRIVIVGSGFAGLGMAITLRRHGIEDFVVLERAGSVGGTWRENTYPGCACDVPSHLYSLSFAPNPDWSRAFSPQPEILEYLKRTARGSGVHDHIRFHTELTDARWDEEAELWRLETSRGGLSAQILVTAIGGLIEPKLPAIPGLADFEGEVFHSARWNHDYDLRGKRVAAVGTGASAIQFVPQIQPAVAELHLFQRTPAWIAPRNDRPISSLERRLIKRFPALQRLMRATQFWSREALVLGFIKRPRLMKVIQRAAEAHLRRQVPDPELRRKLTPDYTIGCKRILISNDFYPSLTRENVELHTEALAEVRGRTVIGSQGTQREVDAIILGTGFEVTDFPGTKVIHGRGGQNLKELWDGSPRAHRCTTVSGFPNLFVVGGPNVGIGHTSAVEMFEHQFSYVLDAVRTIVREGVSSVDVLPEVQERFIAEIDRKMAGTVWMQGGCQSWYVDRHGRNSTLWPDWTFEHARQTREFDVSEYATTPLPEPVEAPREREMAPA